MVEVLKIIFGDTPLKIMEVPATELGAQLLIVRFERFAITTKGDYVMYTLPNDHKVQMQVAYVDAQGNPATIDGEVTWASSDENLAVVDVDDDDTTMCYVVPRGGVGQVQVTATCDADLGEGTRELITTADIEIVGGEAVSGTISPVGEPVPAGQPKDAA